MFEASSTSFHLQVVGGDSRDRTGDLLLARQALSQLSYIPVLSTFFLSSLRRECGVQVFRLRNLDRRANSFCLRIFISSKGSRKSIAFMGMVGPSGLEPPTLRLSVVRSSQLSYGPISHSPKGRMPSKLNNELLLSTRLTLGCYPYTVVYGWSP